jgi:hypothetical protein
MILTTITVMMIHTYITNQNHYNIYHYHFYKHCSVIVGREPGNQSTCQSGMSTHRQLRDLKYNCGAFDLFYRRASSWPQAAT